MRASTFQNNAAIQQGGDIAAFEQARVRVFGARLEGATASIDGSMHISGNSSVELHDTIITNATAVHSVMLEEKGKASRRGGIGVSEYANLKLVRSTVSGCAATVSTGGVGVGGNAVVTLTDCVIRDNVAGRKDSDLGPIGEAGGLTAAQDSTISLENTLVTGNTAAYGGGIRLDDNTKLTLKGNTSISGNKAWLQGGGARVAAKAFSFDDLDRATRDNTAPKDPDISLAADLLQVIDTGSRSGNSTLAKFIPGDVLHLTVHLPGQGGRQSNETVVAALFNAAGVDLFTLLLSMDESHAFKARRGSVMIKQPPGALSRTVALLSWR